LFSASTDTVTTDKSETTAATHIIPDSDSLSSG